MTLQELIENNNYTLYCFSKERILEYSFNILNK